MTHFAQRAAKAIKISRMTKVGFPTTVAEAAQYIELATHAYMRGFTRGDFSPVLTRRRSRNQGTHAVARFPVTR